MPLADEYVAQERWRAWDAMLDRLPLRANHTVLDLGCGPGAVTARLAGRTAKVVGIDRDPGLLPVARARCPHSCHLIEADLGRELPSDLDPADGIWSSFLPAYFPRLDRVLPHWRAHLKPGGWIALVEVDRMWAGHRPLSEETRRVFERFAALGRQSGLYDADMGSKLHTFLQDAGLEVVERTTWPDAELAFQGPAAPEVLDAWRRRFERMPAFRRWLGDVRFARVRDEFLACLAATDHATDAAVVMVIARKPAAGARISPQTAGRRT